MLKSTLIRYAQNGIRDDGCFGMIDHGVVTGIKKVTEIKVLVLDDYIR